ncbi:MAG: N-acetylmuramoyl-L-alanine amidase [Nannocystaceae bacterium]|nr:N-acetylmuramoyl-L-alanine amidase [Nannocystaceae bacterium]
MGKKNAFQTARSGGTVVDWAMRFWKPGHDDDGRPIVRWSEFQNVIMRGVLVEIEDGGVVVWPPSNERKPVRQHRSIQLGLDELDAGKDFDLVLRFPNGDLRRSTGPAGPHSGRTVHTETPPFKRYDWVDYQVQDLRIRCRTKEIETKSGRIRRVLDEVAVVHSEGLRPAPGQVFLLPPDGTTELRHLEIDWRPDWLRRFRSSSKTVDHIVPASDDYKYASGTPTHLVLHQTGSVPSNPDPPASIGGALNTFLKPFRNAARTKANWKGIHYIVDYDGHVVKMAVNNVAVGHAGGSSWRGSGTMNNRAIGIEHVHHKNDTEFQDAQMTAMIDLASSIVKHFGIDVRNVLGHGEVRTIRKKELPGFRRKSNLEIDNIKPAADWGNMLHPNSRLVSCPGPQFDWVGLEKAGGALKSESTHNPTDMYGGFFEAFPDKQLRAKDRDDKSVWGGMKLVADPKVSGNIVEELQGDLRRIGYAVPAGPSGRFNGRFEWPLALAVKAFKARRFGSLKLTSIDGKLDKQTATLIKQVVAAFGTLGPLP